MDVKDLRPECLKIGLDEPNASMKFKQWLQCCEHYLQVLDLPTSFQKQINEEIDVTEEVLLSKFRFQAVTNLVSVEIWTDIKGAGTFEKACEIMPAKYIRRPSAVFSQYKLSTAVQASGQRLESFYRNLEELAKKCTFEALNANAC